MLNFHNYHSVGLGPAGTSFGKSPRNVPLPGGVNSDCDSGFSNVDKAISKTDYTVTPVAPIEQTTFVKSKGGKRQVGEKADYYEGAHLDRQISELEQFGQTMVAPTFDYSEKSFNEFRLTRNFGKQAKTQAQAAAQIKDEIKRLKAVRANIDEEGTISPKQVKTPKMYSVKYKSTDLGSFTDYEQTWNFQPRRAH